VSGLLEVSSEDRETPQVAACTNALVNTVDRAASASRFGSLISGTLNADPAGLREHSNEQQRVCSKDVEKVASKGTPK
jgi:hypothetical protein